MILVIEDSCEPARSLSRVLERLGYAVTIAETGTEALSVVELLRPELIMLDVLLPDTDGLVLTTTLKSLTNAPIILCTDRPGQVDRVLGLTVGADDFISKPLELDALEARIEAVLRQAAQAASIPANQLRIDDLRISRSDLTAVLAGQTVQLTRTEYRLLVALASRRDEVLSRETLGQLVWGYQDLGTVHLIDLHIDRLQRKLRRASNAGPQIATVRGKGYMMGSPASTLACQAERDAGAMSSSSSLEPEVSAGRRAGSLQAVRGALFDMLFAASVALEPRRNGVASPAH